MSICLSCVLDLSHFSAAPSARLSHLPFESDRAFRKRPGFSSPVLSDGDADCKSRLHIRRWLSTLFCAFAVAKEFEKHRRAASTIWASWCSMASRRRATVSDRSPMCKHITPAQVTALLASALLTRCRCDHLLRSCLSSGAQSIPWPDETAAGNVLQGARSSESRSEVAVRDIVLTGDLIQKARRLRALMLMGIPHTYDEAGEPAAVCLT